MDMRHKRDTEATSSKQLQTPWAVNSEYWYEEQDIQKLLELKVKELDGFLDAAIVIAPCLDNATYYGLKAYLSQEKADAKGKKQRHVLIAYNLSLCHWAGIYLHMEGTHIRAIYMDPLAISFSSSTELGLWELSVPETIKQEILAVYPSAVIKQQMYYTQQQEKTKTSCGVLTIENLVAACYQAPQQSVTTLEQIKEFRLAHIKLMQAQGNADFYQRQKENKSIIPSVFEQMQYVQRSNSLHLSTAEWQQLEQIQNSIGQLSTERQQTLIKVLQQPIGDEDSTH